MNNATAIKLVCVLFLVAGLLSCNDSKKTQTNDNSETPQLPNGPEKLHFTDRAKEFEAFLNLFNQDSLFQISRSVFPQQIVVSAENNDENYSLYDTLYSTRSEFYFYQIKDGMNTYWDGLNFAVSKLQTQDSATVNVTLDETCALQIFCFSRKSGIWKLVQIRGEA